MLIRQLEYLAALDRERHFARAAGACHVSQPALSAGVRKLEAELDIRIVRRGHRFEGFTPEGERVLRWAYRILRERDLLDAEVGAMRKGRSGLLRIGALPSAAPAAALLTAEFRRRHPRVGLSLGTRPAAELEAGLTDGSLDCAVLLVHRGSARSAVPLYTERPVVLAGPGRFEGRGRVSAGELAGAPLCRLTTDAAGARVLEGAPDCAAAAAEPQVATDSLPALLAYAAAGDRCAVLAQSWLAGAALPPGVRILGVSDAPAGRRIGLAAGERAVEAALARELSAFARTLDLQGRIDALLPAPAAPL